MVFEMSNIEATVVVRQPNVPTRTKTLVFADVIGRVISLLTDDANCEPELMMVRANEKIAGRTMMAVANVAWLEEQGEFTYLTPSDEQTFERVVASPRTWAIVALTEQLCHSSSGADASGAFYALRALGIAETDKIISCQGISFTVGDGTKADATGLRLTYGEVYKAMMEYHAERGHLTY